MGNYLRNIHSAAIKEQVRLLYGAFRRRQVGLLGMLMGIPILGIASIESFQLLPRPWNAIFGGIHAFFGFLLGVIYLSRIRHCLKDIPAKYWLSVSDHLVVIFGSTLASFMLVRTSSFLWLWLLCMPFLYAFIRASFRMAALEKHWYFLAARQYLRHPVGRNK